MKNNSINPKILKGTRDFGPQDMVKRTYVMDNIVSVFKRYGYDTIETPVIEYADTILGNAAEESTKLTYTFSDKGGRDVALRYDQTVPTARFVAMNYSTLPMPFKRYQISRVWRADKPARGRYREFYQCDVDIIGTESLLAEAEMIKIMDAVYASLGLKGARIYINSRRLMNSILSSCNIPTPVQPEVIRIIDKCDKLTPADITAELVEYMSIDVANELLGIISLSGSNDSKIKKLNAYDVSEISTILELSKQWGVQMENIIFSPSLARGLDYYTGVIFEVRIPGVDVGSVCGGGRYDDLCSRFINKKISGVGVAFGFDRTIIAMEERGLLDNTPLSSNVLVTYFDDTTLPYSLDILNTLQQAQINAEIYMEPAKLSAQLSYANKKQIPYVIVVGPDEMKTNIVKVKNMETGTQETISRNELQTYIANI
jgi:histidyl-tRNA synthetase